MNRFDAKDLAPPLTEARLARQYDAVRTRLDARRGAFRWGRWSLAVVAVAAVACLAVMLRRPRVPEASLAEGAVIESGAVGEGPHVVLADGSRVDLAAKTRARLTSARRDAVRIDVETGRVEVDATHVEGRTFIVGAGTYEVRVVGTHFAVERAPGDRVTVTVDRGAVDVAGASGGTRRLAAGEQWSGPDGSTRAAPSASPAVAPPEAPPVDTAPSVRPVDAPPHASAAPLPHEESAKDLFEQAQQARAEGRPQDAARAFDRLRHAFRHDRRAPLAAFELGRLRLEALDNPRGAEEALRDAIALGPGFPFREDAEARRVEALSRMGDAKRCSTARDAYLARWPNGTYRRAVEVYCGAR